MNDWRAQAACRGENPELFFADLLPAHGRLERAHKKRSIDKALTICRGCPVQTECANYAAEIGATDGIWGGQTPTQRGQGDDCAYCHKPLPERNNHDRRARKYCSRACSNYARWAKKAGAA